MVPKHIAIIMDGNRRWSREQGLPPYTGHDKVANQILEPLIDYAIEKGMLYMTFWAFSTENWNREQKEVTTIMRIFRHVIKNRWTKLQEKGVQIKVIGDLHRFPKDIQSSLNDVTRKTITNAKITVIFALGYGGRDEMTRAINKAISYQTSAIRQSDSWKLTAESFSQFLDTAGIPDPEIIVRPGREKRLSGFLLWQSEYAELFFKDWYMPEFTPKRLDEILEEYEVRQRRFGK